MRSNHSLPLKLQASLKQTTKLKIFLKSASTCHRIQIVTLKNSSANHPLSRNTASADFLHVCLSKTIRRHRCWCRPRRGRGSACGGTNGLSDTASDYQCRYYRPDVVQPSYWWPCKGTFSPGS